MPPPAAGVEVILALDVEGNVTEVTLESPLGEEADRVVEEAARQLRFRPAMRDGVPIAVRISFLFTLPPPVQVQPAAPAQPANAAPPPTRPSAAPEQAQP